MVPKFELRLYSIWIAIFTGIVGLSFTTNEHSTNRYWVYFSDKACSQHLNHKPEKWLSKKSIERRILQNIAIDHKDLPVCEDYIHQLKSSGYSVIAKSKWLNAAVIELSAELQQPTFDFIKKITPLNRYQIDVG